MRKFGMSPRLEGIKEQFERAKLFFQEAQRSKDRLDRFRRLIAAIYFARAVVELMLESANKQEVKLARENLEARLIDMLPRYMLIEKLRIHDFHRFGLIERSGWSYMGPIKLKASRGIAQIQETPHGPKKIETGNSKVEEQRPLRMTQDQVFDDEKREYVALDRVLCEYLDAMPRVIEEFQNLLTKQA